MEIPSNTIAKHEHNVHLTRFSALRTGPLRVLLVTQDRAFERSLRRFFDSLGWKLRWSGAPSLGKAMLVGQTHHAALLDHDWGPGLEREGLDICRNVRALGARTPIVMLAHHNTFEARLDSVDAGADVHIVKRGVDEMELACQVAEVVYRARTRGNGPNLAVPSVCVGGLNIDCSKQAIFVDGVAVPLTAQQRKLLLRLAQDPRLAVAYTDLYAAAGIQKDPRNQNLNNAMRRLRTQLGAEVGRCVRTVRGVGYVLDIFSQQEI